MKDYQTIIIFLCGLNLFISMFMAAILFDLYEAYQNDRRRRK